MNYQSLCLITKYLVLNYMYFYGPNLAMLQNFICCKIQIEIFFLCFSNTSFSIDIGIENGS
jgi:hypothetical protein